jgi:hypothetical protein
MKFSILPWRDHMVFTYSFIVWTEYHEQMNTIIEKIKFNTKDYWGSSKGFRFRTRVDNFSHTVELQADEDRVVKTEFDLITHGYILPESYQLLDRQYPSTDKLFTKKKSLLEWKWLDRTTICLSLIRTWRSGGVNIFQTWYLGMSQ